MSQYPPREANLLASFLSVALNARLLSPLGEAGPVDWRLTFRLARLASHFVSKVRAKWESLKGFNWRFQSGNRQAESALAALPNNLLKPTPGRCGGAARLWLVAGAA
jgi:hypothetical protein